MRKIRDPELLDRLQTLGTRLFCGTVWRMARAGRNPLVTSAPKGRWDDGSFEVLYTALSADAARAEMHFHFTRGQPVFPSALQIHLHELAVDAAQVCVLETLEKLGAFGVEADRFGGLDYARLQEEYSVTQQIGEAAHFLGFEGLRVPNARWPEQNLVIMSHSATLRHVHDHGPQDLKAWGRLHGR